MAAKVKSTVIDHKQMDSIHAKKKSLIIASTHAINSVSGANLRLKTVEKILRKAGFDVDIRTPRECKIISPGKTYDLGVLVSFPQIIHYLKLSKNCSKIWLDSTDSLLKTRYLGLGRNNIQSYIKGILELFLSLLFRNKFALLSYISEKDMLSDRYLFKNSPKFVFPNEKIQKPLVSGEAIGNEIYFVGNYSYNANRRAIKFLEKNLARVPLNRDYNLVIVSNKFELEKIHSYKNGNSIRYCADLPSSQLYAFGTVHISPIWNSVGIKNKILEPASLGLRVFAALPSFNGLVMMKHMKASLEKDSFLQELNAFLAEDPPTSFSDDSIILHDQSESLSRFLIGLQNN